VQYASRRISHNAKTTLRVPTCILAYKRCSTSSSPKSILNNMISACLSLRRHTYMTEMLQIHFEAQPTPVLDSHDGSLQWKDILTGTTKTIRDRFQSEYPALHRRPTGHSPRLLASLSPRPQPPPGQCRPAISSLRSFTQRLVIHRGRRPSGCCNISIFRTGPRIWSK